MRRFFSTAALTLLLVFALSLGGGIASAAPSAGSCSNGNNPLECACQAGGGVANQSVGCTGSTTNDPISGPHGVLRKVSLLLSVLAALAAVVMIIVNSFRYIVSNGDAQKAASARSGIIGAGVGLVIIAAAETIILFVVSKL